ncbi:MAG: ribosome small subunit-dependent GTPase A [Acidobacteriota bacterium]|nr:ribosome small subunit-dependent GTPase A [Acidobacteriota bacterium]
MSREERKLHKGIEKHASREQQKLNQQLNRQRKAGLRKPPRPHIAPDADFEEIEIVETPRPAPPIRVETGSEGLVAEIGPGSCTVLANGDSCQCRSLPGMAIGDRVLFRPERRRVVRILPRRTALSRPDPGNPHLQRVLAANVDIVVNVVSLRDPPLRPGLIDRFLIAIEQSGADAILCVNKCDLPASESDFAPLIPYQETGIEVIFCSAATGDGLDRLAEALAGKTCVFAGHSGVGKSSLLNALAPELGLATGPVSEHHHRGRHTTTASSLHFLPNGAVVIDTPGIREFGLWQAGPEEVRRSFHEFHRWAADCAFPDCSHVHEPRCAVKQAVEAGQIPRARYAAFRRILESLG